MIVHVVSAAVGVDPSEVVILGVYATPEASEARRASIIAATEAFWAEVNAARDAARDALIPWRDDVIRVRGSNLRQANFSAYMKLHNLLDGMTGRWYRSQLERYSSPMGRDQIVAWLQDLAAKVQDCPPMPELPPAPTWNHDHPQLLDYELRITEHEVQ